MTCMFPADRSPATASGIILKIEHEMKAPIGKDLISAL